MNKKIVTLGCALLLTTLSGIAVRAQDVVDPTARDYVSKAFESTLASTSLHIETQSQTEAASGQGFSFTQNQTGSFDIAQVDGEWNASGSRTITMTLPIGEIKIALDVMVVSGKTYLRFGEVPPELAQFIQVPEGWFDAEQAGDASQSLPGVAATAFGSIILSVLDVLKVPVNGDSVTTLSELPADIIDNQPMRVIQITVDPQTVLDSEAAGLVQTGGGAGFGDSFPGGQPGQSGPLPQITPPPGTPQPINPEDVQIVFAVYIGENDQLIHRIYSVIAVSPAPGSGGVEAARTTTTITDFSKYDEPVKISEPELGS